MINSHYISRFLTKPWEDNDRYLAYFDFNSNCFGSAPSKNLYAKTGLFDQQLENLLSKKIERISASQRTAIIDGKREFKGKEWNSYQALVLLVFLQSGRTAAARSIEELVQFKQIASLHKNFLSAMAVEILKDHDLAVITCLDSRNRLFFPDTGIFPTLVIDQGAPRCFFCLPFEGTTALALVPKDINHDKLNEIRKNAYLANLSVGTSAACSRVVIHPDVVTAYKDRQTELAEILKELRQQNDSMVGAINQYYKWRDIYLKEALARI